MTPRRRPGLVFFAVLIALPGEALWAARAPNLVIGKIRVITRDMFDPSIPSESYWPYRAANAVHIQTKEQVVRRELLFAEGDPYVPALLAETERNLRKFDFLRRVRVQALPGADGRVDVTVRTHDAWTLEPQANFERQGGRNSWEIGLVDRNILGLGKNGSVFYDQGLERINKRLAYEDPQFMGEHLTLSTKFEDEQDGHKVGASILRPLYATTAEFSAELSGNHSLSTLPLYAGGTEIAKYKKKHDDFAVSYSPAIGNSRTSTRQVGLAMRFKRDKFEPLLAGTEPLLPQEQRISSLHGLGQIQFIDYLKEHHIDKFDKDEDFNVGPGVSVDLGYGPRWLGSLENQMLPGAGASGGWSWAPGHFTLTRLKYASQHSARGVRNQMYSASTQYYNQDFPKQTLAFNGLYDHGVNLDPDNVLVLGESVGLRGYSNTQFSGTRRLLLNFEDRIFFVDDLFHLISLGASAFFDTGYAWPVSETVDIKDMKSAVGAGLRFAFSRSSRNEPARIDFAYALNDNHQRSRWVISIKSGYSYGMQSQQP